MNSTDRFKHGQAVYVTGTARDFAWPALINDILPPNYVQLIFNNNEAALVEAKHVAAMPEVTADNFDGDVESLPDSFFSVSHKSANSAPTQVPPSGVNELGEDVYTAIRMREQEECDDTPMLPSPIRSDTESQRGPVPRAPPSPPVQIRLMNLPRREEKKHHKKRERLSSKLAIRNRYHQPIISKPVKQKQCCCLQ